MSYAVFSGCFPVNTAFSSFAYIRFLCIISLLYFVSFYDNIPVYGHPTYTSPRAAKVYI